jgi:hypothetical protein
MDEVSVAVREQSIRLSLDGHQPAGMYAEERQPLEAAFGNVTMAISLCIIVIREVQSRAVKLSSK